MAHAVRRQYRAYAGFVTTPQFLDDEMLRLEEETVWDYPDHMMFAAAVDAALGEAADVAAADIWPGGAPTGEDEGFNGIIVRTAAGEALVASAAAAGELVLGGPITPRDFDDFQHHQVRKKEALAARYLGLADSGIAPIETRSLRIEELGRRLDPERFEHERAGTRRRAARL